MGVDLLIVFVAVMISPLVLAGLVFSWWRTHQDRDHLEQVWARYARRRGMDFVPASGEWPNRSAPAIHWLEGSASYRILARGAEALVSTAVVGRPAVAVFGSLSLRRARAGDVLGNVTGDPRIDEHFVVTARPAGLAARLLDADVRRGLLGFELGAGVSLAYERGDVRLRWAGAEENDARLDEARAVVRRMVRAIDAESRRGERAAAVGPPAWAEVR